MDENFSPAELLTSEALAAELVRRGNLAGDVLERLAVAANNDKTVEIFAFLWNHGPATEKQLSSFFSRRTLKRVLYNLEGVGLIRVHGFKYHVVGQQRPNI